MNVVISQSMYFPWVGLLEQVRLADIFVHYDDVQWTRGFYNRVQLKTPRGQEWMTVPLREVHRGQRIDEVRIDERTDWRQQHRELLARHYQGAPFRDAMLQLADRVFAAPADSLADVSRQSMLALAEFFGLAAGTGFLSSHNVGVGGSSSQRLHDLTAALGGSVYITGHGARNYLDHELFERSGIEVRYMQYRCLPYPQLHGAFTPYVSALDLLANCGREGAAKIRSETVSWREFADESRRAVRA